jgi:formylmethanofuran dehydrogenase subunit E
MNMQEILSKIQKEEITVIYEEVRVQFDNTQQTPLGFKWRGRHYEVLKPLLVSKNPEGYLQYLLLADAGVFSLILLRERDKSALSRSRWILNYRVKEDEPLKNSSGANSPSGDFRQAALSLPQGMSRLALVPLPLSNAAYYHGHLCPELAIGYRAAQIASQELGLSRENAPEFFVLAENMSSAIEALQLMTGCTIGNQNFFAYDLGKHVYYFGRFSTAGEPGKALRVALTNLAVDLSHKGEVEKKILAGQASMAELKEYQQAIDDAVGEILNLPEEELFSKTRISLYPPQAAGRQDYTRCSCCGEVMALEKSIPGEGGFFCRVCQAKAI